MPLTLVTIKSGNAKIGPMAQTSREQSSCPTSCPLLNNGCYSTGRLFALPRKYGRGDYVALKALALRDDLPHGIRFNVSGDFLDENGQPDHDYIDACNEVANAHPDRIKIAYTHAWRTLKREWFDFPVNASCETDDDVRQAVAAGWQAVTVDGVVGESVAGKRVVQCPAETRDVTCSDCKLCGRDNVNRPVVSFTVHGVAKNKARAAMVAARS